jgi:hypothetical protein
MRRCATIAVKQPAAAREGPYRVTPRRCDNPRLRRALRARGIAPRIAQRGDRVLGAAGAAPVGGGAHARLAAGLPSPRGALGAASGSAPEAAAPGPCADLSPVPRPVEWETGPVDGLPRQPEPGWAKLGAPPHRRYRGAASDRVRVPGPPLARYSSVNPLARPSAPTVKVSPLRTVAFSPDGCQEYVSRS